MQDLNDILTKLAQNLPDYLVTHGVDIGADGKFLCICHKEKSPSMSIGGSDPRYKGMVAHCFGCGKSVNILHAVHLFEKKAISGPDFYQDTLPYLCKLYGIDYEPVEISEDQKRAYQRRRAYDDSVEIIKSNSYLHGHLNSEHPAIKHLLDRKIEERSIRKFEIGCIDGIKSYENAMAEKGWTDKEYLASADLLNKKLFDKNGIIIPIRDHKGRAVGFVTRKTDMEANAKGQEKYVNSLNSDIYHKSEILYGFNNYDKNDGPLLIVEGYLDVVYLDQCGIKNVVAIGACVLTDAHVDLLNKLDVKDIYICLDNDDGGNQGVELAIERLTEYKNFNIKIIELPPNQDPDSFVRESGIDAFKALFEHASIPFTWTLKHASFEKDPIQIARKAIPTIANEKSSVLRLGMIRDLSHFTGINEIEIKKDVDSLINKDSNAYIEALDELNKWTQNQLSKKKTRDTKQILDEATLKARSIELRYNKPLDNRLEFVKKRDEIKLKIEQGNFPIGLKSPNFSYLSKLTDGIPHNCCLTVVGGRASTGKTSLLTALEIDIIDNNNDCVIMDMSIDDNTEARTLKILAIKSGLSTTQIKRFKTLNEKEKDKVNQAWNWFNGISGRYFIADTNYGNNIDTLENHVNWLVETFPTEKKVFVLDNFHKLRLYSGPNTKKTDSISDQSQRIKDIVQLNDIHLMATIELKKLDETRRKPSLSDLKDSVQMEYDADIAILVHNEFHVTNGETNVSWIGQYDGYAQKMPLLEVNVAKNKITGQEGSFACELSTYNLQMKERPIDVIRKLEKQKKNEGVGDLKSF